MRRWLALAALCASLPLLHTGWAAELDPALPAPVRVGPPPSPAPAVGVDMQRTWRSPFALPKLPTEQVRLAVGVSAKTPLFGERGEFAVALSNPEVSFFDRTGKETHRARFGVSPAQRPPVRTSNGDIALLTGEPAVIFLSNEGRVLSRTRLPRHFGNQAGESLTLSPGLDGGVIVTGDAEMMLVDAHGAVRLSTRLPHGERVFGPPLRTNDGLLLGTANGALYRVSASRDPQLVGRFGGMLVGAPALLGEHTVVAQVAMGRVVALDLQSGSATTHHADLFPVALEPQLALAKDGSLRVVATDGQLTSVDAQGQEAWRTPVDRGQGTVSVSPTGIPAAHTPTLRGALLVDREGTVAVARQGGKLTLVDPKGVSSLVSERACLAPESLLPVAEGRFALYCREGMLIIYGEAKNGESAAP